jgi:hypothetical protein
VSVVLSDVERSLVVKNAEKMFDLLVRWRNAEATLQSSCSFFEKVAAARDLEKSANEAADFVHTVFSAGG